MRGGRRGGGERGEKGVVGWEVGEVVPTGPAIGFEGAQGQGGKGACACRGSGSPVLSASASPVPLPRRDPKNFVKNR
eukprot:scaffold26578_cov30-Tisochrysis_lutea.AAC.1